jgi:hypothetical protein
VDIREFIRTPDNAVMHQTLSAIAHSISQDQRYRFFIKEQGAFGIQGFQGSGICVREYPCTRVLHPVMTYTWLFPDETLALKRAGTVKICRSSRLLPCLLPPALAPTPFAVAMGYIDDQTTSALHQHTWVMYRAEDTGRWMLFDPLAPSTNWKKSSPRAVHTANTTRTARLFPHCPHFSRFPFYPRYIGAGRSR